MKRTFLLFTTVLLTLSAYCQKSEWMIEPGKYSEIKYFAPDMYKVTQNEKVGIINSAGKTILEPVYDAINLFYEGRTIFVDGNSHGYLVKGVLSEDGKVAYTTDEYYLIPDYMFYSEGFLPVRNRYGQYGYLNEEAKPAFDFIDEKIRPFSEGLAAVGEGETFRWITTDGTPVTLERLRNGGTPYMGTNFNDGTAYLWDEDGVEFSLNSDGNTKKSKVYAQKVDYLYRAGTEFGSEVPYTEYQLPEPDATWQPEKSGDKWSYMSTDGKLLEDFNFDTATPFYNGVAIASIDGKLGMLHVVEDNSTFSTNSQRKSQVFSNGTACNCEFQLNVPEKWKNSNITVVLKDAQTGDTISLKKDSNNEYSFSYRPNGKLTREDKKFNVEISNNGIQLWHGEQKFSFIQRVKLNSRISVNNAIANSHEQCFVTAVIKNPSPVAVTTTVTLKGGGKSKYTQFNKKTVTITIPPYSSRSINSSFMVKYVEMDGWCEVSTSDGTGAKKSNLELSPTI